MSQIGQINGYWTGGSALGPDAFKQQMKRWYQRKQETDEEIRHEFGPALQQAEAGLLDHWQASPQGSLALVILFDQFSRNLYRGRADAYRNDSSAQAVALKLVASNRHIELAIPQQIVIYHPLHHAEDPGLQDMAVDLSQVLLLTSDATWHDVLHNNLKFMQNHRDIVRKFGRFPHRNEALGRESTPDEILYLSQDTRRYGQN